MQRKGMFFILLIKGINVVIFLRAKKIVHLGDFLGDNVSIRAIAIDKI